ncbi:MAG: beta-N-acetylhexosaminidase [bacterium]
MKTNHFILSSLFLLNILCLFPACTQKKNLSMNDRPLIPLPLSVEPAKGIFEISKETVIAVNKEDEHLLSLGKYLQSMLTRANGEKNRLRTETGSIGRNSILLSLVEDENFAKEAYILDVSVDGIHLKAGHPAGLFYGIQTLRQLLPAEIESASKPEMEWSIPCGRIHDYPVYAYRGMMLDVSRHFFGLDDVKRVIDLIAAYKLNILHLHLSDDQGWRIEIKSRPKLTSIGSKTQVGGGQGGYYTQEQFREIVNYAADRFITIVPEVEMPGHSNAALASYPELNCDGQARELYTGIEVGFSTLCTDREETYLFVEDVVRELSQISPGPFLHIGGDESLSTEKDDYIAFINRVQDIVSNHGKKMAGWEEIAQADLHPSSVVQHWNNPEDALMAVKKGARVIMSPARKIYMDMQYDSTTPLGLNWAAYIEVDSAYQWDPSRLITGINRQDILGIEAPLWTETILEMNHIEYMVFPRMPGYAEIGWTPPERRNWMDYKQRIGKQAARFRAMGIDYYRSPKIEWD